MKQISSRRKIVLVMLPPWGLDTPPLGLAYISSYLRLHGCQVSIIDGCQDLYRRCEKEHRYLWNFEQKDRWNDVKGYRTIKRRIGHHFEDLIARIIDETPFLVAFSVNQNNRLAVRDIAHRIQKENENIILVAGGYGIFNRFERDILCHPNLFHYFVVGEGEAPLHNIIMSSKDSSSVRNRSIQREMKTFSPFYHKDLSALPGPTFEEFDLSKYVRALPLLLSRGCVNRCAFCNDTNLMGPFRTRSIDDVVKELKYHIRFNNINVFVFNDLAINGNPKVLKKLCMKMIKDRLDVSWSANAMPSKNLDRKMLALMRKSGCRELTFGVESGSDNVLKIMHKPFRSHEAKKVLTRAKDLGITCYVNIIVGFPGEKNVDFLATKNFIESCSPSIDGIGSLNTCNVAFNSFLRDHSRKYDIVFSSQPTEAETGWHLRDGSNNFQLRKDRLRDLMGLVSSMKIPLRQTTLFDSDQT